MNKINYHDQFWAIETAGFMHKDSGEYVSYPDIIPVYVQNIGKEWNGEPTFDIGPVDFSLTENKNASWRWRRTIYDIKKEMGKTLFLSKNDAMKYYESTYSSEQIRVHKTKKELHFIYDNRVKLDIKNNDSN